MRNYFGIVLKIVLFNLLTYPDLIYAQNFSTGQSSQSINDPQRSRSIDTEIFYPAISSGTNTPIANGNFPLIVFGHGFSMNFGAYQNFIDEYVPKGYIIVFPKTEVGPIPFPDHTAFGEDLSFLTDYFQSQANNPNGFFYQKINGKTAVMGHSMGGGCSYLAAEQNSNIDIMATFAAAETNTSAIAAAQNVTIPTLVFAGSEDNVAPPLGNQIDMYNNLASDCKYLITVDGGSHCGFANANVACDFGETSVCLFCNFISRTEQHTRVFSVLTPWLDFYLKSQCNSWTSFENAIQNSIGLTIQNSCSYNLPNATFQAIGDSTFCLGDSIILSTISSLAKKWSNNDTSSGISIKNSGEYYLVVEDEYSCKDTSRTINTNVNQPAIVNLNLTDTLICGADSIELKAQGNYNSVSWQGATGNNIWIKESGKYYLEITDSNNCLNRDSVNILLSKKSENQLPSITAFPSDSVCKGDAIILSLSDSLPNSTFWNNGSNSSEIVTDSTGSYFLQTIDSFGCAYYSDTIDTYFYDLPYPQLDTIKDSVYLISSSNYIQINWFYVDTTFLNQFQNQSSISPDTSTYIIVEVFDSNNCKAFSQAIYFEHNTEGDSTILNVNDLSETKPIQFYPNPVKDRLYINTDIKYKYQLIDINGKIIEQGIINHLYNNIKTIYLNSGTYIIKLEASDEIQTFKILKK